jgi:metal-dependent amidase/aminoacylase/carboxypeptidase family protein
MIERVRQKGGTALFAMFGTPTHGGHHNSTSDADEALIRNAAEFYAAPQEKIAGEVEGTRDRLYILREYSRRST